MSRPLTSALALLVLLLATVVGGPALAQPVAPSAAASSDALIAAPASASVAPLPSGVPSADAADAADAAAAAAVVVTRPAPAVSAEVPAYVPPQDCRTPRHAADMPFAWQQQGKPWPVDLDRAIRCLEPTGRTRGQLKRVAEHIKRYYDAQSLYVRLENLSDDPNWVDLAGRAEVPVHPKLEAVRVERQADGQWRWSKESLDHLEALYGKRYALNRNLESRLPSVLLVSVAGVALWKYLAILLAILAGVLVQRLLRAVVASRVRQWANRFSQEWAEHLVDAIASPAGLMAQGLILAATYPELELALWASRALDFAVRMMIVSSIVWLAYRLVDVIAERFARKASETESKLDDQIIPLGRKLVKFVIFVAGVLFIIQNLGVEITSLVAGLSIGGVGIALASKDTVANFFGSVMIFADRPFQVGDWIVVDGAEGIVEEVGVRSTRIRTFYNSIITVPNARFVDAKVDNYGMREYRRTFVTLNLTYDTTPEQMQAFVEGIRAIIQANEYTRKDYYEVHMSGFGAHSLDVMVYFFFRVPSWSEELRQRHLVFLEILRLAKDLGVSFAFPTQTLHLDRVATPGAPRDVATPQPVDAMAATILAMGPGGEGARPEGPRVTHGFFADVGVAGSEDDGDG